MASIMAAPSRSMSRLDAVLAVLALAVVVTLLLLAPHGMLDKADRAAYAVCHRLPEHSFTVGGRQLPLCARCSGTYLGTFAGLSVLAIRGRGMSARFPARPWMVLLGLFMLAWAVDGLNSFLGLMDLPHLYEPSNRLRLVTGMLEGLVIAAILTPALSITLWRRPRAEPSIAGWHDFVWLLAGGGLVVAAVSSDRDALLYPLALLSGLMVPALLGLLNAMFFLAIVHREGKAEHVRQVTGPLLVGLALALIEIALIGLARDALTARFGLPF